MIKGNCKKNVYRNRCLIKYQCTRKATKDGYCYQHHPDAVKARQEHRAKVLDSMPWQWATWIRK